MTAIICPNNRWDGSSEIDSSSLRSFRQGEADLNSSSVEILVFVGNPAGLKVSCLMALNLTFVSFLVYAFRHDGNWWLRWSGACLRWDEYRNVLPEPRLLWLCRNPGYGRSPANRA